MGDASVKLATPLVLVVRVELMPMSGPLETLNTTDAPTKGAPLGSRASPETLTLCPTTAPWLAGLSVRELSPVKVTVALATTGVVVPVGVVPAVTVSTPEPPLLVKT